MRARFNASPARSTQQPKSGSSCTFLTALVQGGICPRPRLGRHFVSAATAGGFRVGLLLMIAVSAETFVCILAVPAHSLHDVQELNATESARSR
jgi:hypothetical protein